MKAVRPALTNVLFHCNSEVKRAQHNGIYYVHFFDRTGV